MKKWHGVVMLAIALPLMAKEKKPLGDIADPAAFARITSYCFDTQNLSRHEANDVEMVLSRENKPKKLLSKLPWKYQGNCSNGKSGVVNQVKFPLLNTVGTRIGVPVDPSRQVDPELYRTKAMMEISDRDSEQLVYQVEAWPLDNGVLGDGDVTSHDPPELQRQNALYNALGKLVEDVKRASAKK